MCKKNIIYIRKDERLSLEKVEERNLSLFFNEIFSVHYNANNIQIVRFESRDWFSILYKPEP